MVAMHAVLDAVAAGTAAIIAGRRTAAIIGGGWIIRPRIITAVVAAIIIR
jgi:hypothetical protein